MLKMKKILTFLTSLPLLCILGIQTLSAQESDEWEQMKKTGWWFPFSSFLEDDSHLESYIAQMGDYSVASLKSARDFAASDYERAQSLLAAKKKLYGNKKGKKLDKALAKHFDNVDRVKVALSNAENVVKRYKKLSKAVDSEIAHRPAAVMPSGRLKSFNHVVSNGFAGFRQEITLESKGGKNTLNVENQRRLVPDDEQREPKGPVEVDDSVFVRVRDMVEQGSLYDVGRYYSPAIMIMDASNWSMSIYFEGGSINSSGYADGPDHHETLNAILQYLSQLYESLTKEDDDAQR